MAVYGYGNNRGGYHGDTLAEMIEHSIIATQNRYSRLIHSLVDLIGRPAVDAWADQIDLDHMDDSEAAKAVEHKLESYECSCTPVHEPCSGCQRLADDRRFTHDATVQE